MLNRQQEKSVRFAEVFCFIYFMYLALSYLLCAKKLSYCSNEQLLKCPAMLSVICHVIGISKHANTMEIVAENILKCLSEQR